MDIGGASGNPGSLVISTRVDLYNVVSATWTTASLCLPRYRLAAAGAGNLIVFAGGAIELMIYQAVDIYNTVSNTWTTSALSGGRFDIKGGALGNTLFFIGGY